MNENERALVDANVRRWWESRRPDDWSLEDHLNHPTHRTVGCIEEHLARAVADMIRKERGDL